MRPLILKELTKEYIDTVLNPERKLITALIGDLKTKGREIAKSITKHAYTSIDEFFEAFDQGKSEINLLDGSSMRKGNIITLTGCVLHPLRKSLLGKNGKLPSFYNEIEKKYVDMYKRNTAILNPLCIVCQVVRETLGKDIKIGDRRLFIQQVACRSEITGKRVYSEEGLRIVKELSLGNKTAFNREDIEDILNNYSCLYFAGTL